MCFNGTKGRLEFNVLEASEILRDGDPKILRDIFIGTNENDPLHHASDFRDGAMSILT